MRKAMTPGSLERPVMDDEVCAAPRAMLVDHGKK
jgi:hypothetical protein